MSTVGIVVVSHSEKIAQGVVELASQVAASVSLIAAGGADDGGIGTSFAKIHSALSRADSGSGVVIIGDLGSAIMTAESVVELLEPEKRSMTLVADAPLVEGAVAAAVAAETGSDLAGVLSAAESASGARPISIVVGADSRSRSTTVIVRNPSGLHARPAVEFVKLATTFDAQVTVNGVDAKSLLSLMSLGIGPGADANIQATGPDAAAAITALVALVESGFGEL